MSRHGLEIRAATPADAAALAEILPAAAGSLAAGLDAIRQGPGTALLALEWGPPSGVVVLHWYRTLLAAQPVALVTLLFVAEDARRRGVGRLLLKAAAQAARVAGCGELEVADQGGLTDFLQATGFSRQATSYARTLRKKTATAE